MNLPIKKPKLHVSKETVAGFLFGLSIPAVAMILLDIEHSDMWFYLSMVLNGTAGLVRGVNIWSTNVALLLGAGAYFITIGLSPIFPEFPYWSTILIYARMQVIVAIFARVVVEQ